MEKLTKGEDMSRTSRHRIVLGALAAATSLGLLTGCSTTASPTTTRTVTAAATAATGPTTPPTESATPAAPVGTTKASATPGPAASASGAGKVDPSAPSGQCKDSSLAVTVQHDPEGDGAGQRGAFVVFRNTSSSPCRLEGTPGLSLVGGGNGTQIGKPAARGSAGAKLVTIAAGKYALAGVTYTYVDENGGNFSDGNGHDVTCQAKAADGYRVYPPHSYRAYFTDAKTYACSTNVHWISVGAVKPAAAYKYFTPKP